MSETMNPPFDPDVREDVHERARCLARESILSRLSPMSELRCLAECIGEGMGKRFGEPMNELGATTSDYAQRMTDIAGKVANAARLAWDEAAQGEGETPAVPSLQTRVRAAATHAGRVIPDAGSQAFTTTREFSGRLRETAANAGHEWVDASRELANRLLIAMGGALTGAGEALNQRTRH